MSRGGANESKEKKFQKNKKPIDKLKNKCYNNYTR